MDKQIIGDVEKFANKTSKQRAAWTKDVETFIREKEAINKEFEEAWNYEMQNIDVSDDDGQLEIEVDNKKQIMNKWAKALTDDAMAKLRLEKDFKKYMASIAAQRAAFRRTARAKWPPAFQAYAGALQEYEAKVWGWGDKYAKW